MSPRIIALSMCFMLAVAPRAVAGQTVDELIAALNDANADIRIAAFNRLLDVGFSTSDQLKVAAIALLDRETAFLNSPSPLPANSVDAYEGYFPSVIQVVASLNDPRSARALAGVIDTGATATRALAALAPASLNAIAARLASPEAPVRSGVAETLVDIIELGTGSTSSARRRILAMLNALAMDGEDFVAIPAIAGWIQLSGATPVSVAIRIRIEVEPRERPDRARRPPTINLRSNGIIRVAFLSSPTLDATGVDIDSVTLAAGRTESIGDSRVQDMNGDGLSDLVSRFRVVEPALVCGEGILFLTATTTGGEHLVGADRVVTTGCSR